LSSRLQQWNILDDTVKVTTFRSRKKRFSAVLLNAEGLFAALNIRYYPEEWRLVIGSSILSLKAVLLSKGNLLPSIVFASTVHKKEAYENKKDILICVNYKTYQ
jgi:hypothetical protein